MSELALVCNRKGCGYITRVNVSMGCTKVQAPCDRCGHMHTLSFDEMQRTYVRQQEEKVPAPKAPEEVLLLREILSTLRDIEQAMKVDANLP